MWFLIGVVLIIIFGVWCLIRSGKQGDMMIKKVQEERRKGDDCFGHFMPERRKGERRNSQ